MIRKNLKNCTSKTQKKLFEKINTNFHGARAAQYTPKRRVHTKYQ